MTWIISKALMNSLCSQEQEEESLEENYLDGTQSVQLNGNHTQLAYCAPGKMTDFSRLSPFGMMFKPLMESLGEELLMLYREGFHVKTLVPQVEEKALQEKSQVCGNTWQESLGKSNQLTFLPKTPLCSLNEDSKLSLKTWPRWGTMQNGVCWEQTVPTSLIEESEYGCWVPTLVTSMWRGASSKRFYKSQDYKGSFPQEWIRTSKTCEQYLNPDFAEPLMGFPDKWTDLKPLGTHKFQLWQQQHGIC